MHYGKGRIFETVLVNGKGVILRGDFDFTGNYVPDRVISSAVTEFQLIALGSVGQTDDLMPETDAENGIFSMEFTNGIYKTRNIAGISRPVGK